MRKPVFFCAAMFFLCNVSGWTDPFRTLVAGNIEVSLENTGEASVSLNCDSSAIITLGRDVRFLRGIELELSVPQIWLSYPGSVAMEIYAELDRVPSAGLMESEGQRIAFEPLPNKLNIVYHIPIRTAHGLRNSPYVTVPAGITRPSAFPILLRLMSIVKGLNEELENMVFHLNVRPILSDEGAIRIGFRYPEQLRGRPFILLIDDMVVQNPAEEQVLREGEHHLVVLSDDYRNESRRFMVERAKIQDLIIELQDPTPLIIFEGPQNARIFLNNVPVLSGNGPIPVEPGIHEAKFQVGDYTIIKTLSIQRGKTYLVALSVDIDVQESD
jgi:hypothetical protein